MGGGISKSDPIILKSARRVYATDCVYVYASGADTICQAEAGTIRLKDTDVSQGFEIIQDVFDFYEDWYGRLRETMASGAYQKAVDDCWQIFHNPMILLDASSKVLGITSHYQDNPPDAEWAYLMKYGYSSVQAVQYMKLHFPNRIFAQKAIRSFEFQGKMMNGRGIGCGIYQGEILIGRVTVLEKERGINSGDYHVLKLFTDCFLDSVRKKEDAGESLYRNAVFSRLLQGEKTEEETINRQLSYCGWEQGDRYQVILARITRKPLNEQVQDLVKTIMENTFPHGQTLKMDQDIVLIWNLSKEDAVPEKMLKNFMKRAEVTEFYGLAMDFMVLSGSLDDIYHACHPDVISLWEREQKHNDELFDTFAAYVNHDCSIKNTCEALFMHRNTLIYRVRKLMKLIQSDINDSYTRSYMRLSVRVLRLYQDRISAYTQT